MKEVYVHVSSVCNSDDTLLYRCDHSLHLQVKSLTLLLRNLILKKGVRQPWRLSTQKYCLLLWWLLWGMYHSQATYASKLNILYYIFNYCSQDLDSIRIAKQTQWIVPRWTFIFCNIFLIKVNMRLYLSHACFLGRWHIPFECRSIATMIRAYLFTSASERVVARLKKDLFSHLIEQAGHLWSIPILTIDVCLNVGFHIVDSYNCEARDYHLKA